MRKRQIPTELLVTFVAEGRKAKRDKKKIDSCPYGMSHALTASDVDVQVAARSAWMIGYNEK